MKMDAESILEQAGLMPEAYYAGATPRAIVCETKLDMVFWLKGFAACARRALDWRVPEPKKPAASGAEIVQ